MIGTFVPNALEIGIVLAGLVFLVWVDWLQYRPITDTDRYCTQVDDDLDLEFRWPS